MYCWRITKYNPNKRNNLGVYAYEDWTAFSDIGKDINDKILTYEEYKGIEKKYINAVLTAMQSLYIKEVTIRNLEKHDDNIEFKFESPLEIHEMKRVYNEAKEGKWIGTNEITTLCKLILREYLWCKLEKENVLFIHFGYDYYMYFCSKEKLTVLNEILQSGMFIEEMESPYLDS